MLKDFVHQFQHKKEILICKRHNNNNGLDLNKNSLFNNYIIDVLCL